MRLLRTQAFFSVFPAAPGYEEDTPSGVRAIVRTPSRLLGVLVYEDGNFNKAGKEREADKYREAVDQSFNEGHNTQDRNAVRSRCVARQAELRAQGAKLRNSKQVGRSLFWEGLTAVAALR